MDTAFQLRQLDTAASNQDERAIYQAALGELSEKSRPFLESVTPFLEAVIETAALASETPDDEKEGGRPRNLLMHVLAGQIAHGFVYILEQQPTTTTSGPYSEVLHLAAELVSEQDKPSDLSRYVRRAVQEMKEATARPNSK